VPRWDNARQANSKVSNINLIFEKNCGGGLYKYPIKNISRTAKFLEGKKKVKKHDRFVNPVPLRDTDDALFVNWCELTINNDKNKIIYRNAFATDYVLNGKNILG
jgi:hypothetical protein